MSGFSDYMADAALNFVSGQQPAPAIGNRFLALFTTAPTDAGTGGTEVSTSGTAYARQQIAGAVTAAGAISTGSATFTGPNVSGFPWVVPGMNVYDVTASKQIGTLLSWIGTTVTLTGNAANNGSGSTDVLQFSAFPAAGSSAPSTVTNGGVIAFAAATGAGFGTVVAFGIYDAVTSGNLLDWDYMGNFSWAPVTVSSASPGVITMKANGLTVADTVVFSTEYGGTAPSFSQSNFTGLLAVAHQATDTLDVTNAATAVNTSSTGSGMVRKVGSQAVPAGVTASFAASALTLSAA